MQQFGLAPVHARVDDAINKYHLTWSTSTTTGDSVDLGIHMTGFYRHGPGELL
jgi:hypothetical protein